MNRAMAVALVVSSMQYAQAFCPNGFVDWKGGCAAMPVPESQKVDSSKWASDEKPSRHPEPAWQRGEVQVIDIQSFKTEREEANAQIKFAQLNSTGKPSGLSAK